MYFNILELLLVKASRFSRKKINGLEELIEVRGIEKSNYRQLIAMHLKGYWSNQDFF